MKKIWNNWSLLSVSVCPCFVYEEGEQEEDWWADSQNADYYFNEDDDENNPGYLNDGRKHWMIQAVKPKGVKITEENEDLVRYIVWDGPKEDLFKEWDLENHCVKGDLE